jgi:hypothetical protein
MPARRLAIPALALVLAALSSGCGGEDGPSQMPTTPHPAAKKPAAEQPRSATAPRAAAPSAQARVIRRWSDTLRGGDEVGAAHYFALPSVVQIEPGQPVFHITRRAEAVAFQSVLPCGARLLRAERDGRYVNALFRLTMRPGAKCDAPGATARTDFVIRRGKIAEWRRAPDEPGDGGGDGKSASPQAAA